MNITQEMKDSPAFQYAYSVRNGGIITGKKIKTAVQRFFNWIDEADNKGFEIDHQLGMRAVVFFPNFLNHTIGKLSGQPFFLAPFQTFTIYNLFGWVHKETRVRRINTVYDKRAKKNGKTAEIAGLGLYCMSFDLEMGAQIYVGATKEDQAKICWNQAKMFIESPVANPALRAMGFQAFQKEIKFPKTQSSMMPLGGDSKTQDGVNAHLAIIDEYHAHRDDSVKQNLESSAVSRKQPITYHITTAGVNFQSACKRYEDAVIEVLEGRNEDDSLWIMIHDLDEDDDWEDQTKWHKANPLLGNGLDIANIQKEYVKAKNQLSKIPNFKTKHLNMWVDAPSIWIPNEVWMKNKVDEIPMEKFKKFRSYGGLDLSTTKDITCYVLLSEPDEDDNRYIKPYFFIPEEEMHRRSKDDGVPYDFWVQQGWMIATPGNVVDYEYVKDKIKETYHPYGVIRVEADKWNCESIAQELTADGVNIAFFGQGITTISFPTKQFEKLVYEGKLKHDGNPVLQWMLAGCIIYEDASGNIKVHKGQSNKNGRRIDGIVAIIIALGGSLSPEEEKDKYSQDDVEVYI